MKEIAVNVAVLQDDKILLTQHEDFETWILPGFSEFGQEELYNLHERSGLQRQRFYMHLIEGASYHETVAL